MLYLYKIQTKIVDICFYFSCLCMLYLTFFISADVIFRSFGVRLFSGTVELSEYALLAIGLLCAPWVYKRGSNLKVDILIANKSDNFKKYHAVLVDVVILFTCLFVFYYGAYSFFESIERDTYVYKMLVFPEWYINWIIPVSMLLVSTEALYRLYSFFKAES
ncbi:TRAP transporter small permease [Amphritea opalescens]|uniref:TRAP transporter small permease protein n=1 Tax=Amphritea opalescens TaxID=2490544 RepID=A0A430KMB5_9GAMM|nr:TRAP transporter small permease [Amphritea opalescens]